VFNVGGPEILVILLVALVILGPEQLPKAMRTFGNVMAEVRKVSGGFQAEMRKAIDSIDDSGSGSGSSSSGASATSSSSSRPLATTPEEADVTEVVARNTGSDTDGGSGDVTAAEPGADRDDPPAVSPADRAAG
jgi:sec-independent protein translocase protein TatB